MAKTDIFKEYIWLVETVYEAREITFADINERWLDTEMSGGVEIARSTFNRHRMDIAEIFGIHIDCNRRTNEYFILNRREMREGRVANWLMTTLSVSNMLTNSVGLQDRIILESVPAEGWALNCIMEAMRKNRRLWMMYRKIGETEPTERLVEPYCLKLYHRRWYLLVKEKDRLKVFALAGVMDVRMTKERFRVDKDFSAEDYFGECFGVVNITGMEAETVVLRAYGKEVEYMTELPLHKSQAMVRRGDGWADFELRLKPTDDFQGHTLSRAGWLQVRHPEWLAEAIKQKARRVLVSEGSNQA